MIYQLIMKDRDDITRSLKYDAHKSILYDEIGDPFFDDTVKLNYKTFDAISKDQPGKKGDIRVLKISLGLKCNFSCSYCSQTHQIEEAADTNNDDAKAFLDNLSNWLRGTPSRIEIWGGEPLVYWSKMKILVPALKEKFPNATLHMHTNGSLLDDEKLDFIEKYDIITCISHDGPQQKYRGPDPLSDPKIMAIVYKLFQRRPNKTSFNIVLHSKNYDLDAIAEWFHFRVPKCNLSLEGIVNTYDSYTLGNTGRFTLKEHLDLSHNIFMELIDSRNRFPTLTMKMQGFIKSLQNGRPIEALGQKCGMDRSDSLAVDLNGNVMTCQNTGGEGVHKIGTVDKYDDIKLNTATHFTFREECMSCPVVQLCQGSCMFLEKDQFAQSCWNEYYYNLGILRAALFHLTGYMLVEVRGNILRPEFTEEHLAKYPSLKELYT